MARKKPGTTKKIDLVIGPADLGPGPHHPHYVRPVSQQRLLDLVQRCAERAARLLELEAPELLVGKDRQLIDNALARLEQSGWSTKDDPLPDALRATLERLRRRPS